MTTTPTSRDHPVALGAMLRRELPPASLAGLAAAVAEGLDELWIVKDLPFAGGIAQLAAVLEATVDAGTTIGHGIAPAPFRTPAALAMEWATLAAMYPGRLHGGIGHGVQSWMAQLGERVDSPLTLLEETIVAVRSLLAGERLGSTGRYVTVDDVELVFPPATVPPVSSGVMGPRSLDLSGRVADGTVLPEGRTAEEIRTSRARIDEGREAAGRTDPHRLTVFVGFHCGPMDRLGPPPPDAPPGFAVVTPDVAEAVEQLAELVDAGADSLVLVPFDVDLDRGLRHLSAEVVPAIRQLDTDRFAV